MPTDQKVLERNAAKVIAALDGADRSATELESHTGLNWADVERTVNYLKSLRRLENRDGLLHLVPVVAETSAPEPAAEASADPAAQAVAQAAATSEPAVAAPADPPAAPTFKIITPSPDERRTRIATLRADERLQGLIATRRADYPDAFMPAPRWTLKGNWRSFGGWFDPDGTQFVMRSDQNIGLLVSGIGPLDGKIYLGAGPTPRAAYTAAYRELRLAKYDKAKLLRAVRTANRVEPIFADLVAAAVREESRATIADLQAQRQRALLTARRRGPALAVKPEWNDAHTLVYLRRGWPKLDATRQQAIAVQLLNEIVLPARQRNNAWFSIVRAVSQEAK